MINRVEAGLASGASDYDDVSFAFSRAVGKVREVVPMDFFPQSSKQF